MHSLENIVVAITNLPAYYPIMIAFNKGDMITGYLILNVAVASFISHLFESHKHGMPGFGMPPKASFLLNLWDILGCILVIIRFLYLIYYVQISFPSYENIFYIIIAYIFHLISQYDNTKYKWLYILSHCIWHILIFIVMGKIIE